VKAAWCAAGAVCLACVADAQAVSYARVPGDTLAFRESTTIDGASRGPAGSVSMFVSFDAGISVAFLTADSVHAWYDSLAVSTRGRSGSRTADVASVLRQPFVLRMLPKGRVQTLRSPTMPTMVRELAEFRPQFEDFFPRLPPGELAVGVIWADTIERDGGTGTSRFSFRRVNRYRVEDDTVVAGEPAVRVRIVTQVRMERSAPLQRAGYTAHLTLSGTESGVALLTRTGRLIRRERSGTVEGKLAYQGGPSPTTVDQLFRYRGAIAAVPHRAKSR
jgi:hypothetical protein